MFLNCNNITVKAQWEWEHFSSLSQSEQQHEPLSWFFLNINHLNLSSTKDLFIGKHMRKSRYFSAFACHALQNCSGAKGFPVGKELHFNLPFKFLVRADLQFLHAHSGNKNYDIFCSLTPKKDNLDVSLLLSEFNWKGDL